MTFSSLLSWLIEQLFTVSCKTLLSDPDKNNKCPYALLLYVLLHQSRQTLQSPPIFTFMWNIFLRGIQKRFLVTDEYKARMWCSELKWQHESTFTPASNISPIRYVPYLSRRISLTAVQSSVDSGSTLYFPHDHINVKFQCRSPFVHQSCSVSFLPLLVTWLSTYLHTCSSPPHWFWFIYQHWN